MRTAFKEDAATLDLSGLRRTTVKPGIGMLKELKTLLLNDNCLHSLPLEIRHLTQLENLNLASNKLTEFPRSLIYLKNLKVLNLSGNALHSIPYTIIHLKNLEELYLNDNIYLSKLPENLKIELPHLKIYADNTGVSPNFLKKSISVLNEFKFIFSILCYTEIKFMFRNDEMVE